MPEEQKKIAGINKNWWYVIGAVVGVGAYLWYRNYKNNAQANALQNALASEPSGASTNTTDTGTTTTTGVDAFTSLQDWMNKVQSWAPGAISGVDAAVVQNALQAYAQGNCLTAPEYKIIDEALAQFGMPPDAPFQGLIQCPNPPPPPKKQPQGSGGIDLNKLAAEFKVTPELANVAWHLPSFSQYFDPLDLAHSFAVKLNEIAHSPVPGYSSIWGKLTRNQQIDMWNWFDFGRQKHLAPPIPLPQPAGKK